MAGVKGPIRYKDTPGFHTGANTQARTDDTRIILHDPMSSENVNFDITLHTTSRFME